MRQRCVNPNDPRYSKYGLRGIKVCTRWDSFQDFVVDVGPRPPGVGEGGRALYSLDRIDNDGDYKPGNVRWATAKEQGRNSSYNRLLTFGGKTLLLCEWAECTGIQRGTIAARLKAGVSVRDALTRPVGKPANARRLQFRGQTKTVKGWAKYLGIPLGTITTRLARDWSVAEALSGSRS